MTVRLHLIVPALTPSARRGIVGVDEGLDEPTRKAVSAHSRSWPESKMTCAPQLACAETADLIGLHPEVDPRVGDWDLGAWTGRSLNQLATTARPDLEQWSSDPDFAGHGGESLRQLLQRSMDWLEHVEADNDRRLVTLAPVAVVRAALVCVLDAPTATFWRLDLEPLASVHISLRPGRRAVRW